MRELQPLKAKRLGSDWKTEIADLHEWAPMELEPMPVVKEIVLFFVREALLNMRKPR